MKIAEIFHSVQGEGSLVGVPSVFIRTSGCNLRCVWCDTPYTSWQPEGDDSNVESIVAAALAFPSRHVVVTGGEPMIQPSIGELTTVLHEHGFHITIETAGTVDAAAACHLMSISPKLSNSTPIDREEGKWAAHHDRTRLNLPALRSLMARSDYQMKFVVSAPEDLDEIVEIVALTDAKPAKVILMPEGIDHATLAERGQWIVPICMERGYRFSPRLHVDLWGHRRGV